MTQQGLQQLVSMDSQAQPPTYQTQPTYAEKFKEPQAKELIQEVLKRKLGGAYYHPDNSSTCAALSRHARSGSTLALHADRNLRNCVKPVLSNCD